MLSRLVFSVTYDCPISCKYCVTESGPWHGPSLDAGFMIRVIDEARELGRLASVVFTGGEALLKLEAVTQTLRHVKKHRLWSRIVTNSFWANSPDGALRFLADLKQEGLCEVNLSCDDLHQEHIPLENVRNAYRASRELDLPVLIAHKKVKHGTITPESIADFFGAPLTEFREGSDNARTDLYSSSLTVPVGYLADRLNPDDYIIYPGNASAWSSPCGGILSSIIISPSKKVRICCGMIEQRVPELTLGDLETHSLAEIISQGNADLITNWLALEGPYGIMRFVQQKAPEVRFRDSYVNHCHLCNDLFTRDEVRSTLAMHAHEKSEAITLQRGVLEAVRFRDAAGEVPLL
jgi:hypothetical protein